jgi:hypothetical protein
MNRGKINKEGCDEINQLTANKEDEGDDEYKKFKEAAAVKIQQFYRDQQKNPSSLKMANVADRVVNPDPKTLQAQIEASFDELYNSLDSTKPVVFIITTHGSRPRTSYKLIKKLKEYMESMKSIIDTFKNTLLEYSGLYKNSIYENHDHEEQIQVSYIKAYLDGIYQILDEEDVQLLQRLLIEKMGNYHTEAPTAASTKEAVAVAEGKKIPKKYINDIAKKLKDIQFFETRNPSIELPRDEEWWMRKRVELMRGLLFDDDNYYLALMALNKIDGENRWETIQKEYKPGDSIDVRVDKILSQQSITDTHPKGTDWSVRLVGGHDETISVPYLFSTYSDLIDIGAFTINNSRLLSIESLHLLGSKIIQKRKQEYMPPPKKRRIRKGGAALSDHSIPINTTMMIVDFSCGTWRERVTPPDRVPRYLMGANHIRSPQSTFRFPQFSNSSMAPKLGCAIAGGGTKSKKKKSHKSKKFKNNKKRSNKKINRRKYTRKK